MATRKRDDDGSAEARSQPPPWSAATEIGVGHLGDARLDRRLHSLVADLSARMGASVPFACQDWAATKAAYRFFSNPRVDEAGILAGHFAATRTRAEAGGSPVLVLHDTTTFSFQREALKGVGLLNRPCLGRGRGGPRGRVHHITVRGFLMHSSLALTLDGLPLGLTAVKFWNRQQFKGCDALKRKINPTRVPVEQKESFRWLENLRQASRLLGRPERLVHVGDREADIFELFAAAAEEQTRFLVRTCVDRLVADTDGHTVAEIMRGTAAAGTHRLTIQNKDGAPSEAVLSVSYRRLRVLPPAGKQARYPAQELTLIHATETGKPEGREAIRWKLLTNLAVDSLAAAVEKLGWYARRWKIEVFHKVLKSGGRAEASLLRDAERLVRLVAVFCVVAWRVFWLSMAGRAEPESPPTLALTAEECRVLDRLTPAKPLVGTGARTLSAYLTKVARLGGYLARRKDPPPGFMVLWRGLCRLMDIQTGVQLGRGTCG